LPATVSKWLHQPFPTTIFLCTFEVTIIVWGAK